MGLESLMKGPMLRLLLSSLLIAFFCIPGIAPAQEPDPCAVDLTNPSVLLDMDHPLGPSGKFRLVDLRMASASHPSKTKYFKSLKDQLNQQFPEVEYSDGDK